MYSFEFISSKENKLFRKKYWNQIFRIKLILKLFTEKIRVGMFPGFFSF